MTDSIEDVISEYCLNEEGDWACWNERGTPEELHYEKGNFGEDEEKEFDSTIYKHTKPTLTLEEVKQLIRESELRMIETINSIQLQHKQETPNPPGTPWEGWEIHHSRQ